MLPAQSHRDLRVFEASMTAATAVYALATNLPRRERFGIADQILRSSRAVPALIAEAWARRRYPAAFREKLSQAAAESVETEVWLEHIRNCRLSLSDDVSPLIKQYRDIGGMLTKMIRKAPAFVPPEARPR